MDRAIGLARRALGAVVVVAVGFWLFKDTYSRHFGATSDLQLRIAFFGGYEDYELWSGLIEEFRLRNPDIAARLEYTPGPAGAYVTRLHQQSLADRLPDVMLLPQLSFPDFWPRLATISGEDVSTEDAGGLGRASLRGAASRAFTRQGDRRGVPVSGGSLLVYCNPRCFARAAERLDRAITVPANDWTLDEFVALARALTLDEDGDGRIDQFGLWLPRWVYFLPFTWTLGADYVDEASGQWLFEGEAALSSLRLYRALGGKTGVAPSLAEMGELNQDAGFLAGRVGMCVNGPWFQPFLDATSMADEYVVLPIPSQAGRRATRITWDALASPRRLSGLRRESAMAFLRFMVSRDAQRRIARTGRALPIRDDALGEFTSRGNRGARREFVGSLDYARAQPNWPAFARVDRAMQWHYSTLIADGSGRAEQRALASLSNDPVIRALGDPTADFGGDGDGGR